MLSPDVPGQVGTYGYLREGEGERWVEGYEGRAGRRGERGLQSGRKMNKLINEKLRRYSY